MNRWIKKLPKFLSKVFIVFLIFVWIFSGWPRIWQNPRIPPKIQEIYGATNVKVGTFTKITTTGNQSITGLGFQPKAIIFFWSRNTVNATATAPRSQGIGFTDCTNQRVVAIAEDDNAGTSNAGRYRSESNVIVILSNGTPAVESRASFVSCDADGFTINWAVSSATAHIINYIALGGPDITNVKAGTFTLTNTTGNQSVTGLGFRPEFLMFLWSFTENVDTATAGLEMGFGFADAFGNQGSIANSVKDNEAANKTKYSQQRTDQVILLTNAGAQDALASFVSMDNDGFTVNKSDAPAANTPIFYLAIRGGSHKVGNFLQPTATGVQSITGVGFQPQGLVLFSRNQAAGTTLAAPATISFGAGGQAITSRTVVWGQSMNKDPSQTAVYTDNTKIMVMRTLSGTGGAGTINAQADLQSFDADGFSLNWTTADTTQRQIIYWAIGNSPTFNQSAYRFFNNLDSTDVGTPLANQDTPATLTSPGQAFRLRLLIYVGNGNLALYGQSFKLQFGTSTGSSCSTGPPSSWEDVTTTTVIAFNDNPTPTDGSALTANSNDPIHGTDTIRNQTYEEANPFTNSVSAINSGEDGKWDFSLKDNGAPANTTYCFRVVKNDGSLLDTYSVIPQITTSAAAPSVSCTLSATSTSFGNLSPSSVSTSSPNITITVSCSNTSAGCTVYVKDSGNNTNPGLYNSTANHLIPSSDATLSAGTEGYGIQAATTTNGTGGNLSLNSKYNQTGNNVGGLSLTDIVLASSTVDVSNREVIITHKASISNLTPAGNYQDSIIYSCNAN